MKRAEYFNKTIPTEDQLNYTEDSKVSALLERLRSDSQLGVVNGFIVTVNPVDSTLIDVGPGEGYTGGKYRQLDIKGEYSGERISTINDSTSGSTNFYTVQGQALASYVAGIKNYVSLVYAEVEDTALAEIDYPFTPHNTIVRDSFSVSVLAETDWNLLSLNEKRRRFLVAIITANGAGVPLTASSIQQVVQPKSHPTPTQPSNVSGAIITSLSQETLIGAGTLRYESSTKKLYWTAPGSTEGAGVTVTSSGSFTLYSFDVIYWITVEVTYASLPAGDETDSIDIISLYGSIIPRFSAVDSVHRDMVGSGVPTLSNPHGMTIDDLPGGGFDHADLFHRNGISYDSDPAQLECIINPDPGVDEILINNLGGFDNSFLVDGRVYEVVEGVPAGTDAVLSFDTVPSPDSGEYLIYLDSAGSLHSVKIGEVLWDANIYIVDMSNKTPGNATITWNAIGNVLTYQAPGDGAPGAAVRITGFASPTDPQLYKLYSSDLDNWVIVEMIGSVGLNNSTTFDTDKNNTTNDNEVILKLAVVGWDAVTETLSNVRDIRRFFTADIGFQFEEEHDSDGSHTKVLQNTLRLVNTTNPTIRAIAESVVISAYADDSTAVYGAAYDSYGVYGLAGGSYGVFGSAGGAYGVCGKASSYGVYGTASNYGVYGSANGNIPIGHVIGVYGSAVNVGAPNSAVGAVGNAAGVNATGVAGYAANGTGVYGSGDVYGIYGTAAEYAIRGVAAQSHAVWASAPQSAIHARAGQYAVWGSANSNSVGNIYGVFGSAVNGLNAHLAVGVIGQAGGVAATGVFGSAAQGRGVVGIGVVGVYGSANTNGVYGKALVEQGVYGEAVTAGVYGFASTYGVYGESDDDYGVYGTALVSYGVLGKAATVGVKGIASTYGVYGEADTYGVYGLGGDSYGVYGQAATIGVMGKATGINSRGVRGVCTAAGGYGVEGVGDSVGVFGDGDAGGWFEGDTFGVVISNTASFIVALQGGAVSIAGAAVPASATFMPIVANGGNTYLVALFAVPP
ncbi:MAG: hypothetical protein WC444_05190 [Candidatus Paceibacterota bacterium]